MPAIAAPRVSAAPAISGARDEPRPRDVIAAGSCSVIGGPARGAAVRGAAVVTFIGIVAGPTARGIDGCGCGIGIVPVVGPERDGIGFGDVASSAAGTAWSAP